MDVEGRQSLGARFQDLSFNDQTLALCRITEGRGSDRIVRPKDVSGLFEAIGLPSPPKVSDIFQALKSKGFLIPTSSRGEWRLTPRGKEVSSSLVSDDNLKQLTAETNDSTFASLGNRVHSLLPPSLAPVSITSDVQAFVTEHPFDLNVFVMTRFPKDGELSDPVKPAIEEMRRTVSNASLELHTAADRAIVDDLWGNVIAHIWASRYGVAIFEDRAERGLNYNMSIEVGSMMALGRRCLLLKDESIDKMPTDLVGRIYKSVDLASPASVGDAIRSWLSDDLRIAPAGHT